MLCVIVSGFSLDSFGVEFIDFVNFYVLVDCVIKYGLMFIVLIFVIVGLIELLIGWCVYLV